jgi:hypothetical protein
MKHTEDTDVFSRMGSEGYDAYMIRRTGESTCAVIGGAFRWVGHYWNRADNAWNDYTMPRDIFTVEERASYVLPIDGEWVGIFYNNGGK